MPITRILDPASRMSRTSRLPRTSRVLLLLLPWLQGYVYTPSASQHREDLSVKVGDTALYVRDESYHCNLPLCGLDAHVIPLL